jgi:microcin C transport system ATP-binding protein
MALLALQPIASGHMAVEGITIEGATRKTLRTVRRRMQVVFQDPFASLSPRLTIEQILDEGLALHAPELTPEARRTKILETLAEVGLDSARTGGDLLSRYPHEFSGGQRQRIAIARAIVIRPDILILDEPTSALDVSVQQQVLALLSDLQQRYGMSYIFISHDLAVIRAMAHRIIVMKDGAIVEAETTENLFNAPREDYTKTLLSATL